ncbi:thiamine phosphate synthase [Rothia sp. P100]|uniref:thiamine phosphate synthase n=1 Tax=Rothia sp. P100 TaxID=2939578 RepID=UPI00203D8AB5|nr:thiamine phosphate synthase [Rothia sp. P100]MCM3510224.1 thiamine phosphate synthase [Rothia sp. P100]
MIGNYGLYLVTDSGMAGGWQKVAGVVAEAIDGGVNTVQVRDKELDDTTFSALVESVLSVTEPAKVPLVVNDRVEVAAHFSLDVHIGQGDMPLETARELLGAGPRIGLSVGTHAELRAALSGSIRPDLIGMGPVYATSTKKDAGAALGLNTLQALAADAAASGICSVAIGGLNTSNIAEVSRTGVAGCCVVSAIMAATDPAEAARALKELMA